MARLKGFDQSGDASALAVGLRSRPSSMFDVRHLLGIVATRSAQSQMVAQRNGWTLPRSLPAHDAHKQAVEILVPCHRDETIHPDQHPPIGVGPDFGQVFGPLHIEELHTDGALGA